MRGRLAIGILVMVWTVPIGVGQAPSLTLGTEDLPEIPDPTQDVQYHPLYTGSRDHEYIDLSAGWFEYDNATDRVTVMLRTTNAKELEAAAPGWTIGCDLSGNVTVEGKVTGSLAFGWTRGPNSSDVRSSVRWHRVDSTFDETAGVAHRFEATLDEPGYFRISVERVALLGFGTHIQDLAGTCLEIQRITLPASTPFGFANPILNFDEAASEAVYSFEELRQTRTAAGEVLDPIERVEREDRPSSRTGRASQTESGTPGPALVLGLAALCVGALWRRGRA